MAIKIFGGIYILLFYEPILSTVKFKLQNCDE